MSVHRKVSLAALAIAAFVAGILFTTAGANIFDRGHQIGTPAVAENVASLSNSQVALVEPSAAALSVEKTFTEVAEKVNPAVVQIRSEKVRRTNGNPLRGTPFEDFLGDGFPQEFRSDALGSGVIAREDGYIITNNHVVESADQLEVKLFDGRYADATVVGTDPTSDLAVIKVELDGLPTLPFGNIQDVKVGQWVMAFGSPLSQDLSNSVTAGIVSAVGRTSMQLSSLNMFSSFIQTDAAINPGNSGGALVNIYGQLIGINSAILSRSGGSQGVGLAITADVVENVVNQLINDGKVSRGFLGVTFGPVSPSLSRAIDAPRGAAQVTSVRENSPALKAGLKEGDIIVAVDGQELIDQTQLRVIIGNHLPGETVSLAVIRDQKRRDIRVTLAKLDEELLAGVTRDSGGGEESSLESLGMSLGDITQSSLRAAGVEATLEDLPVKGVLVVNIDQSSEAFRDAEIRRGDIITEIDKQPVASLAEFERLYKGLDSGDDFIVRVARAAKSADGFEVIGFITALRKP